MERWKIGKGTEEKIVAAATQNGVVTGRRINSSEREDGGMSRQNPLGECHWSTR